MNVTLCVYASVCWNKGGKMCDGGDGLVTKSCPTLGTPWTVAHQALLSVGFPRQEYWSGWPCPSLGEMYIFPLNFLHMCYFNFFKKL